MDEKAWDELKRSAMDARSKAYAPYSGFSVGAAIRTDSGQVFIGCNVENASYGATICAERAALAAAVAAGERHLMALAIASSADAPITPCGICRQCLAELGTRLPIRSYAGDAEHEYQLSALLPDPFGREQLD